MLRSSCLFLFLCDGHFISLDLSYLIFPYRHASLWLKVSLDQENDLEMEFFPSEPELADGMLSETDDIT
jgi:hypothetical protein